MTRKLKKRQATQPRGPERSEQMTSGAADRLASQFRRPSSLLTVCGSLLLAVIIAFGQTANHAFVFDDLQYVSENPHVIRGLTGDGIVWASTTYYAANWHPLTWLSHMLDCQLYGLKPRGHHLTNVLLHAATAILLFLAFGRITGALWTSAWVAAVFAVHPLRVESVAWVAERKDVLSGLFFTLTLWFYARYVKCPASWRRYILVVASFVPGLAAKPMLVTLPFVLLLLDYWPLGRLNPARAGSEANEANPTGLGRLFVCLVVEKIPLFVLAAASCVVTLSAQRSTISSLERLPISWRAANAAVAYVAYLGKMIYPAGLAVFYPLHKGPLPAWEVIGAVTLLLAISTAVFLVRRKLPCLLFGWLWYLGTLAPVIGLVQVGEQAMADRYSYLTQIGLYTAFAWGAVRIAGSRPNGRLAFAAVSAVLMAGLIVCDWQQTRYWRDSETLWTHTLACTKENFIAHNNLGKVLAGRGDFDEAIRHFRTAMEIKPDYVDAHNNLGVVLAQRGRVEEAIVHYRKALEINPHGADAHNDLGAALAGRGQVEDAIGHYRTALEINPDYVDAHNNLGVALAQRGEVEDAIRHYRNALEINPDYADAHNNLGVALTGRGKFHEAIGHFRKALEIKPDYVAARNNLGKAFADCGQVEEAISHYRKALEINPAYVKALYNLGVTLAGRGQVDEAVVHFRKALEINPDDAVTHYNLGVALAGRGDLDEAIQNCQKALALASTQNDKTLADIVRARIKLLQSGVPIGRAP